MPNAIASRQNGRKGGRPLHRKNNATLEREAVLRAYRERVCLQAQRLLDAELTVALGCTRLFRKPKDGGKVELVTDEATIRQFLDGELPQDDDSDWYFLTTEKPDTLTIRNIFDRTFDKPPQRIADADGGTLPLPPVITFLITQQAGAENQT